MCFYFLDMHMHKKVKFMGQSLFCVLICSCPFICWEAYCDLIFLQIYYKVKPLPHYPRNFKIHGKP